MFLVTKREPISPPPPTHDIYENGIQHSPSAETLEMPSPSSSILRHHQQQLQSPSSNQHKNHHIHPYMIQAAALQQHIAHQVHHLATSTNATMVINHNNRDTSDESSETSSLHPISPQTQRTTTTTATTILSNNATATDAAINKSAYPMLIGRDGKPARPFKAYPRDPLSISAAAAADTLIDNQSAQKYHSFRKRMLEQIHAANGGQATISNPKMRRNTSSKMIEATSAASSSLSIISNERSHSSSSLMECSSSSGGKQMRLMMDDEDNLNNNNNSDSGSGSVKDSAYFERRKKNNAAAKKSRDRRRIKEDEIAIRAAFLERENIELKYEMASLRKQLALYGAVTTGA